MTAPAAAEWLARQGYLVSSLLGGAIAMGLCHRFGWGRSLGRPIDGGRSWRGRRLFGDHKTFRGLVVLGLGTAPVFWLQATWLHELPPFRALELFDYGAIPAPWAVGFALGVAASASELPNSFAKRQLGISSGSAGSGLKGAAFFVIDQVDLLLGFWLVLACFVPVDARTIAGSVAFLFVAHQAVTLVGYFLRLRKSPR